MTPPPEAPATGPAAAPPAPPAPPPLPRAALYVAAGVLIALAQALGSGLILTNTQVLGGALHTTSIETTWLIAAFMAPRASLALLLIKLRTQFGLRRFAEVSVVAYVAALLASFWMTDLPSAIALQFLAGIAAAPMSSLAFLYTLEAFPPALKMKVALPLVLTLITIGTPLARMISPWLETAGNPHVFTLLNLGLALLCTAFVTRLPLNPMPRAKVISLTDLISYAFLALGLGGLTVVFVTGTGYWWAEAPWIGVLTAVSIAALAIAVVIELQREAPLIDVRWIASPAILHLAAALLLFRILLAEQSAGAPGLFLQLGLGTEQLQPLFIVICAATLAGGAACALVIAPGREGPIHLVALALIAWAAWADSHASVLTRPEQMFLTQGTIAFASALFLPPAMMAGLMSALARGPSYILSFIVVFLTTQSLGGVAGSALFRSFVTLREQAHLAWLRDGLDAANPLVGQTLAGRAAGYAGQIADPALRQGQAAADLARSLASQAWVAAYNDAFRAIAVAAAAAFLILFLQVALKAVRARGAAAAAPESA
ncbi:MFS transporter [Pseudoroseicyclus aestuarii]|uniref:MFS transporter n=1 Tax=Pseudoroseicyclus aestuarii TaxID=1795041 RepID=A0A318SSS9_9RHOB|nr:MFS transporter [Pseudoroseicyclus aestuarii]PYE84880.1 hypothetical protein DFP88_102684 [Pseudoroseicyclus aestuarii]